MGDDAYREGFLQLLRSTNREDVLLAFEIVQGMPDFQPLIEAYQPLGRVSGISSNDGRIIPAQVLALNRLEELSIGTIPQIPEITWDLQHLRRLTIHNMSLKSLPDDIVKLTNLEWLRLFNASFECLPDSLSQLKKLRKLEIVASIDTFPIQVCRLGQLTGLRLGRNQITQVPAEIGLLSKLEKLE